MSEHHEQRALIDTCLWYANRYPELHLLFAVPNGGLRTRGVAGKLKAEGVKSGVPDLLLLCPRNGFHGLAIEMKTKKGQTSEAQEWWIEQLTAQGYRAEVCKGYEAAWSVIKAYLGITE